MNTKNITLAASAVVLMAASFYGGMLYQERFQRPGDMMRMPNANNQRFMGQRGGQANGFIMGEILKKDATSVTIKMQDGSTKIVLMGESTEVTKSVSGSGGDLTTGLNISVAGSPNPDGSVTAQTIQIRPEGAQMRRPQ